MCEYPGFWFSAREAIHVFDELTELTTLSLELNRFDSLPADVFDKLTKLKELKLNSNPNLKEWSLTFSHKFKCVFVPAEGGLSECSAAIGFPRASDSWLLLLTALQAKKAGYLEVLKIFWVFPEVQGMFVIK